MKPVSSGTALIFARLPPSKRILQTATLKESGFQPRPGKCKYYMSVENFIENLRGKTLFIESKFGRTEIFLSCFNFQRTK